MDSLNFIYLMFRFTLEAGGALAIYLITQQSACLWNPCLSSDNLKTMPNR